MGATKSSSGESSSLLSAGPLCGISSSELLPSRPMARFLASFSAAAVSTRFLILSPLAVRNSRRPLYSLRSIDVNVCSLPSPAFVKGVALH